MPLTLHLEPQPLHILEAADVPAWRILHREADRLTPELIALWQTVLQDVHSGLDIQAVRAALERNDMLQVEALLTSLWEQQGAIPAREVLVPLLRETIQRTATAVTPHFLATAQARLGPVPLVVTVPASIPWIDQYAGTQIRAIGERTIQAVRQTLRTGFAAGTSVQQLAAQIRTIVGLTPRQAQQVATFRQRLRDEGLSAQRIARDVDFAVQTGIRQRALNIARTESMAAANAGQEELWRQASSQGLLEPDYWQRQWLTAQDERVCPICGPMGGQRRDMEQPFTAPGGETAMFPPIHPSCRCTLVLVARGSE